MCEDKGPLVSPISPKRFMLHYTLFIELALLELASLEPALKKKFPWKAYINFCN